jgi:hypothetical protein
MTNKNSLAQSTDDFALPDPHRAAHIQGRRDA